MDELVAASAEDFKLLIGKLTKDWLLWLPEDTVSHFKQAMLSSYIKSFDEKLDNITEIVSKNVPNANLERASSPCIQSSSWAEVVKITIEERDYDKEAEKTVIYSISNFDDIKASQSAGCIFGKTEVQKNFIVSANRMEI